MDVSEFDLNRYWCPGAKHQSPGINYYNFDMLCIKVSIWPTLLSLGLRLALGAFCTSPVSSMYTEANEAPAEERRLKLSMNYYLKTCACTDNPVNHALHEFDPTTKDLYLSKPNGKGGMTQPPTIPIGLKVEEALTTAEIDAEMVCPLKIPSFPPGTHEYDPKRHSLIEGVNAWSQEKRLGPNSTSITMF